MKQSTRLTRPANEILRHMDLSRSATPDDANEMGSRTPVEYVQGAIARAGDDGILAVPIWDQARLEK